MALFATSSQNQSWLMTNVDVEALTKRAEGCVDSVDAKTTQNVALLPNKRSFAESVENTAGNEHNEIVLSRYSGYIQHYFSPKSEPVEGIGRKHWRVAATAISYFRRFYLNNSLCNFDPRLIMAASVFLAGKVEDSVVSVTELTIVHKPLTLDILLATELLLIQGLHFHLKVFHPLNVLHTLLADYKRVWEEFMEPKRAKEGLANIPTEKTTPCGEFRTIWREKSEAIIVVLQRSAAVICHTPTEIALAALQCTENQSRQAVETSSCSGTTPIYPSYNLEQYLGIRFGDSECRALLDQAQATMAYVKIVEIADANDAGLKAAMDAIRKKCSWDGKKPKKEKAK